MLAAEGEPVGTTCRLLPRGEGQSTLCEDESRGPALATSDDRILSGPQRSGKPPPGMMAGAIGNFQALIAGGMGWGTKESLQKLGIEVVITDVKDARDDALRHAGGDLPNLVERLH